MTRVIIPFRGGDEHRERNLEWVKARYKARFPRWEVVCGEHNDGPWCKAQAVLPALRTAPSDVVVLADADVWTDGLERGVHAITSGVAEWAVPHGQVYRFNRDATDAILTGELPVLSNVERRPYLGIAGGGLVIAHRDTFLRVPLDPRFEGIDAGHEDEALGMALSTLCGSPWRGSEPLLHLWHPLRPRLSDRRGSVESWELCRRYMLANRNPEAMQALIEEFNDLSCLTESSVHDRAA